jgi:hypothetical protein
MQALIFNSLFMADSPGEGSFIERRERSPYSRSAWRTPADVVLNLFRKIAAVQDFVLELLPRETSEFDCPTANQ